MIHGDGKDAASGAKLLLPSKLIARPGMKVKCLERKRSKL